MFILRQIIETNVEVNLILGNCYVITYADRNPEEFEKYLKDTAMTKEDSKCYGYISYSDGASVQSLFETQTYYIMTESGKTFANLTYNKKLK